MSKYAVFGSWKIRHSEKNRDAALYLLDLGNDFSTGNQTCLLDFRGTKGVVRDLSLAIADFEPKNFDTSLIPLAIISIEAGDVLIHHLLMRLEIFKSQFFKLRSLPAKTTLPNLTGKLVDLYDANYLYLNNFECYYEKGIPDTELEQKYTIQDEYNFYKLNEIFYSDLDDGKIKDFAPHLGDEIEHWSYDNHFFEIDENPKHISGYVSIMHWSRKKKISFDEQVVTFKKKLFSKDSLERWERNYHFQKMASTPKEDLESFFELPLLELPDWRRVRLDIACEYMPTGDIYMLNFEDSRIKNCTCPKGKLQQCEIEYLKTRGNANLDNIYVGFNALDCEVEKFISRNGLNYTKNHYSKLTFLKEFHQEVDK